jgi:hypothetical protein
MFLRCTHQHIFTWSLPLRTESWLFVNRIATITHVILTTVGNYVIGIHPERITLCYACEMRALTRLTHGVSLWKLLRGDAKLASVSWEWRPKLEWSGSSRHVTRLPRDDYVSLEHREACAMQQCAIKHTKYIEFKVIPVTVTSEKLMHKNDTQNLSFACTMQSGRVHDFRLLSWNRW